MVRVARQVHGVRVIDEPRKGLVTARERGRREARADLLVYLDADCRAPIQWLARVAAHFERKPTLLALSGNYRFYDWGWGGRALIRAYDLTVGPGTQLLVKHVLRIGVGGFDTSIEFHGEDTNLGRRLFAIGRVELNYDCYLYTSARRCSAMGTGAVFRLYVRNFVSELLYHRPKDSAHVDIRN